MEKEAKIENYRVYSSGQMYDVSSLEEALEIVNPDNDRIEAYSPDGGTTYYYDSQEEADADKDGAYTDSITEN